MEGSSSLPFDGGTDPRVARLEAQLARCRAELRDARATEARCRALFEQSPLSIQVHGPDGRCRATNPAHDRLWNVTGGQMAAWDPRADPQLAEAGVGAVLERAFAGEAQVVPAVWFDAARVAPGGKRAWVDAVAFPLRDEAGRVAEVAIVHQDVTALRRAERLARGQADVVAGTLERLAREPDLGAFIGHVLAEVSGQLGAATGQVTAHDAEAGTLTAVAEVREGQAAALGLGASVARRPGDFFDLLLAEGGPRRFDLHAEADLFWPGALAFHRAEGHRCVLATPLLVGGEALGHLGLAFRDAAAPLEPGQVELLRALASQVALALKLKRQADQACSAALAGERERAAEQRAAELARVNAVLRRGVERTAAERDFGRLLDHLLLETTDAAGAAGGALFLHKGGTAFEPVAVVDEGGIVPAAQWRCDPLFDGFAGRSGRDEDGRFAAILARGVGDPAPVDAATLWPEALAWHRARGNRVVWHELLVLGGEVVGFLGLARTDERPPGPEVVDVVRAVVGQMAVAAQLARLAGEAREAAVAREREAVTEKRAAELARANEALRRTAASLAAGAGLDALLPQVMIEGASQVGAVGAALLRHDPATDSYTKVACVLDGRPVDIGADPRMAMWRVPHPANASPIIAAVRCGPHFHVQDPGHDLKSTWPDAMAWHATLGHRANLVVPLLAGARWLGFLTFFFRTPVSPSPERIELAQALAQQAALALELTRLAEQAREAAVAREREQAAEERAAELGRANAALRQAIESLRDLDDLDAFLARVVAAAEQVSGAAMAAVFLVDADRREMQARLFVRGGAVLDIAADPALALWRGTFTEGAGYDQRVADKIFGSPGHWWVAVDDPLMAPPVRAWHEAQGHRSVAHVPMFRDGRPLGFLGLAFRGAARPSAAKLEMAQVLAQQVTLAFELTRLADEARAAAVAREREAAAEARAAELGRVNGVLRRVVGNLADASHGALDDAFLRRTVVECCRASGAANAALFLRDGAEGFRVGLAPVDANGAPAPLPGKARALFEGTAFPAHSRRDGRGLFARLLAGEVVLARTDDADGPLSPEARAWHAARGHETVLDVPMMVGARVVGYLGLAFGPAAAPDEAAMEVLRALAGQAALAAELGRLADAARDAAVAREREHAAEHRAQELARANAVLTRSTARLAEQADPTALLGGVLLEAAEQAEAVSNALFLYDPPSHTLSMTAYVRHGELLDIAADPRMALWREPVPADLTPAWERLKASRPVLQVVGVDHPDIWAFAVPWHRAMGHVSLICVPLFAGERALGFMGLCFATADAIAPERTELAQALANQAALALELTRLAEQAREAAVAREREQVARGHAARLAGANQALARSAARLAAEPELEGFLRAVLNEAAGQAGAFAAALMLYDPDAHALNMRLYVREGETLDVLTDPRMAIWREPVPARLGPAWAELSAGRPVTHLASPEDRYTWPHTVDWHAAMGHAMVVAVPLLAGECALGFMGLSFRHKGAVAPEALELAQALASQAVLAMELTRLAEQAREATARQEREQADQERAAELARTNEALRRGLDLLAGGSDYASILGCILAAAVEAMGESDGSFSLNNDDETEARMYVHYEDGAIEGDLRRPSAWAAEPVPLAPELREQVRRDGFVWHGEEQLATMPLYAPYRDLLALRGVRSVLSVPAFLGDRWQGSISVRSRRAHAYAAAEIELVRILAQQGILVAQLTRLADEARDAEVARERERAAQDRAVQLARANEALRATLNALPAGNGGAEGALDPFLAHVLAAVAGRLGAPEAVLWLHDMDAGTTRVHQVCRDGAVLGAAECGLSEAGRPIPLTGIDPGWKAADASVPGRPEQVDDVATDPRLTSAHRTRLLAQGTRALVLLPLALRGRLTVGTVSLRLPAPRRFAPEDMELAMALAQQATLAIHLDQLARRARDEARQSAVLDERNRAAQEIHDTLAQCFTSIFLQLQAAARFTDSKPELARACLGRAEALARDGLAEARRSVAALLPGAEEHRDLPGALRRLARQATTGTSAPAVVRVAGTPRPLAPEVARGLYRIAQEALGNAQRYAHGATRIRIALAYTPGGLLLGVADDGAGFDPAAPRPRRGHGLAGMRQRAEENGGTFRLDSAPGRGTRVRVELPLRAGGAPGGGNEGGGDGGTDPGAGGGRPPDDARRDRADP